MIPEDRDPVNGTGFNGAEGEGELAQVLDAYLAEVEAGRPVDPEEWVERHPAIAARLRACLKSLHLVEAAAEALALGPQPVRFDAEGQDNADAENDAAFGAGLLAPEGSPPERPNEGLHLHFPDSSEDDPDGPRLGDFRVIRELGRGGMGVVYEAEQHSLGRRVALKVLPFAAAIDPRQIARFRVEAQAASHLNHPHIVPVYSVGCQRGVHYYAMQLIDGPTLAERIAELRGQDGAIGTSGSTLVLSLATPEKAPAPAVAATTEGETPASRPPSTMSTRHRAFFLEAARLGRQAAEALEHAHQQGVLHRDVKPSNLIVDGRGHLWVTDFGLARFQGEGSLTATGDLLGTLRYMSPEQALANRAVVDQRTDVYSLGATLYELLTLQPAFAGSDRQELFRKIAQEEPRRPRAINPAVPRDMETIIVKAMAKDPAARYVTAQELADDLHRFLDDRPILARPPGPLERSARWARRHTAAVVVALPLLAIMVLGLTAGIIVVLAKQAEIERARDAARTQRDQTRRAIKEWYTDIAEDWLGQQPDLQPLQREFLLKALKYYQAFALERDPDPAVRAEAGEAAFRVAEIQRKLGHNDEAERAYRQAIAVLEAIPAHAGRGSPDPALRLTEGLPTTVPDGTSSADVVRESLCRSYSGLGSLLIDTNRSDEAEYFLHRATELTQALVDGTADTPDNRPLLASSYHRLGILLRQIGRPRQAETAYRKAVELAEAIGGLRGLKMEAGLHGNLGIVLTQTGQSSAAEQSYRDAVKRYQALVQGEPAVPVYRQELARSLRALGNLLAQKTEGKTEAERVLRRALELYDRLAADAPDVPQFHQELAPTLLNLAKMLWTTGRSHEAEPLFARAGDLYETLAADRPDRADYRVAMAMARFHLGSLLAARGDFTAARDRLQQAVASQREALRLSPHDPTIREGLRVPRETLTSVLIRLGDHAATAAVAEDLLRDTTDRPAVAALAANWLTSCASLAARDETLARDRREAAARSYAERALDLLREAARPGGDPTAPHHLAWFLVSCPVAELRDPVEAIRIVQAILERAPNSWVAWATLGAAHYRAGDDSDAIDALERAAVLNQDDILYYGFFLAMGHHRLGHQDLARDAFDRSDRWLQAIPWNEAAQRIRAEAAELLGQTVRDSPRP
jgi:serine/threonine protein kinase/Flp pilus assembly protein TadD